MRRLMIAALVCSATLALGTSPAVAKKKPNATTTTTLAVTADSLRALLLTVEDMPSGYAVDTLTPPATSDPTGGFCNGPNTIARADAVGPNVRTNQSVFRRSATGPVLAEIVYAFPNRKQAKAYLAANRAAVTNCPSWDGVDPTNGKSFHQTLAAVPLTKIADDTYAFKQTDTALDGAGVLREAEVVYVRSGRFVVFFSNSGLTTDTKLTSRYARKALDKLAPILG